MATSPDPTDRDTSPVEVTLTAKAQGKCHRLLAEQRLREAARHAYRGTRRMWRRRGTEEYHIYYHAHAIVVAPTSGGHSDVTVITQMHRHVAYNTEPEFERVSSIAEAEGHV